MLILVSLYFVQDENSFINPLLQVGSGSDEKSTGSGGPKINSAWSLNYAVLIYSRIDQFLPESTYAWQEV